MTTLEAERLYLYAIVDGAADAVADSAALDGAAPTGLGWIRNCERVAKLALV